MFEAVFLTVITASTPLLIAAIGELVCERSGVLNLGVEGMMVMGAVCGFAATVMTGSAPVGVLAGIAGGVFMAMTFAVFIVYGVFAASVRHVLLSRPRAVIWMRRTVAAAFAGFGLRLALSDR